MGNALENGVRIHEDLEAYMCIVSPGTAVFPWQQQLLDFLSRYPDAQRRHVQMPSRMQGKSYMERMVRLVQGRPGSYQWHTWRAYAGTPPRQERLKAKLFRYAVRARTGR